MEKSIKLYKSLSQTPSLTGANFLQNNIVYTYWNQRNVETGKFVKYFRSHMFDKNSNKYIDTFPTDISQISLTSISPKQEKQAVLREISKKQYIEIWTNNILKSSVDLLAANSHGDVYTDGEFKSWHWSPDESKILYIAEKKVPKSEPFYKRSSESGSGDEILTLGEEYTFRDDWGEQFTGKYKSVIAIYNLISDKIDILKGIPEDLCPGQVSWSPDGLFVIGVALITQPRRLGLIYCTNRPGIIFRLNTLGIFEKLSEENCAVSSPRYSPDGKYLVWLERPAGGPHNTCFKLMKLKLDGSSKPEIVIDIVEKVTKICNNENFYGFYNSKLQERCWASNNRLLYSTVQQFTIKTYVINIESKQITELKYENGSQSLLDVHNNYILVCRENYTQIPYCSIGFLPENEDYTNIEWINVTSIENIEQLLDVKHEFLNLKHDNNDEINECTAIYFGPKEGKNKKTPLIVCPHGGPHSSYYATFLLAQSIYVNLGFAIVMVNYRGSTGHGTSSLNYLLGRIGTADVQDCLLAVKETCCRYPWIDPDRIGLVGGSHGGFIVHHLSGQYPDMFRAVVSRNPVIDIVTKSITADNPDWCSVEAGFSFNQAEPIDKNVLLKMREMSPINHAHKIETPTLLLLGSEDRRVSYSQGLELMYRLKANGVQVKTNIYEDNHPLSKIPHEMDHIIHSVLWLLEHV